MALSLASLSCSSVIDTSLDALEGLVSYKTLDHEIVYCNSQVLRYAGFNSVEEIRGCDDSSLAWSDYTDFYIKQERDALEGKVYTALHPSKDVNGRCFLLVNHKLPWRNENGELIGLISHAIELNDVDIIKQFHEFAHLDGLKKFHHLAPVPAIKLSPRENDCLFFLLQGRTAKETGRQLSISHRTVEVHVDHLKTKFGCKNKSELIAKALKEGYGGSLSRLTKVSEPVVLERLGGHR